MRSVISLILVYCLAITSVFAQSVNPNDTLKIGKASSSSDKGLTFDTNDGVSNKKLLIEKISKKLKFDGNTFQIGDGSSSSDKELIIAGALKSLKYNGTSGEFEFNDDVKLSGTLKADFLQAVNTEVAINSLLRASQGIKVGAGANEIRVNAGNLEFSNDGVLYKKFGTGTGGSSTGISILENASFEDGITTGWTSSGGTFSQQTYTNGVEGDLKYARFVASTSGQYVETTAVAIPTSFSGGCQADFKKVNVATAGLFKIQAMDTTGATIYAEQTIGVSNWIKVPTISFPCPTAGTMVKLRLISLAAGTIDFDRGYLGSNQGLVSISQSYLYGSLKYAGVANCEWLANSATFTNFSLDNDCLTPSISGKIQAPATKIPAFVLPAGSPAGTYYIVAKGMFYTVSGNYSVYRFSDGTNSSDGNTAYLTSQSLGSVVGQITYGSALSVATTINIQTKNTTSSSITNNTSTDGLSFDVFFYPLASEVAVSNEQSSWFIDANIGGSNIGLALSNQPSYVAINSTAIDLVNNTVKGSANVEIACLTGFSSTGLNCGANSESLGIAFTPPSASLYEVCFDYTAFADTASNGEIDTTFQLVETPNNSLTILQEGGARLANSTYLSDRSGNAMHLCGSFNFADTSKRTIRLMYEQSLSGGITSNSIFADRSATSGQRDIHVTVRPLLSAYNRPVLTGDQVTTPGMTNPKAYSSFVSSVGAVANEKGDLINGSCVMSGTSSATFDCPTIKFLSKPNCQCTISDPVVSAANFYCQYVSSSTSSNLKFFTVANGSLSARDISIFCHGD